MVMAVVDDFKKLYICYFPDYGERHQSTARITTFGSRYYHTVLCVISASL
jgi:hypothetical protein